MNDAETRPARVFVGVKIASDLAQELSELTAGLKDPCVRRVAPGDIHLTLVPPWQERSIEQAIERLRAVAILFSPLSLRLEHLGYGPQPRRPGLVWIDCAASEQIAALRAALMQAFGQQDHRPFRPHITLARIRGAQRNFARTHPIDRGLSFAQCVRSVELFRSPPPGATGYQVLASIALGAAPVSEAAPEGAAEINSDR